MFFLILFDHRQICRHCNHPEPNELEVVCLRKLPLQANRKDQQWWKLKTHWVATVLKEGQTKSLRPTLGCRRTKCSIEIKCFLPLFAVFGRCYDRDTSLFHVTDGAIMAQLPTQEGSNSTVHPNISYQNAKNLAIQSFRTWTTQEQNYIYKHKNSWALEFTFQILHYIV